MPIRLTALRTCPLHNVLYASFLASCMIATPCAAQEFDLTPDTTQYLADPSFIPRAGQIYSASSYDRVRTSSDLKISTTTSFSAPSTRSWSSSSDSNQFTQTLWYGITDQLSFSGSETYLLSDQTREFVDPTLTLRYRAIEQIEYPVSVDLLARYYPPAVNNEQAGTFGFYVSREMTSLTLQFEASATYYDTKSDFTRYWVYLAGIRSEWRFDDQLALDSGVVYQGRTGTSSSFSIIDTIVQFSSQSSTSYDDSVTPYIGLSYEFWPSHANISIAYQHTFTGDITTTSSNNLTETGFFPSSDTASSVTKQTNGGIDLFNVSLRFLF